MVYKWIKNHVIQFYKELNMLKSSFPFIHKILLIKSLTLFFFLFFSPSSNVFSKFQKDMTTQKEGDGNQKTFAKSFLGLSALFDCFLVYNARVSEVKPVSKI